MTDITINVEAFGTALRSEANTHLDHEGPAVNQGNLKDQLQDALIMAAGMLGTEVDNIDNIITGRNNSVTFLLNEIIAEHYNKDPHDTVSVFPVSRKAIRQNMDEEKRRELEEKGNLQAYCTEEAKDHRAKKMVQRKDLDISVVIFDGGNAGKEYLNRIQHHGGDTLCYNVKNDIDWETFFAHKEDNADQSSQQASA